MTVYTHTDGTVRTFDRIPTPEHVRAFLRVSAEDKILQGQIDALAARVSVLEGKPAPTPTPTPSGAIHWPVGIVLDQEAEGECVGFGCAHLTASDPKPNPIVGSQIKQNPFAEHIYEAAQKIDGQTPDEQSGTSVGAGMKALQAAGVITAAHSTANIADVKAALSVGPVLIGSDWYTGQMTPDANDQVHVTGTVAGGHAYLLSGYDPASDQFVIHNSWGAAWGRNGDAWISTADLSKLLAAGGEAWSAVKV